MLNKKKKTTKEIFQDNKEFLQKDKVNNSSIIKKYFEINKKAESDRVAEAFARENIYKKIAIFCGFISILCVGAVIALTPLKQVRPYVITVNQNTGYTELVPQLTAKITPKIATTKYWLSQYIIQRFNYNWYNVANNYNAINLMSNKSVFAAYSAIMQSKSGPLYKLGKNTNYVTTVNAVTLLNAHTAQVRYTLKSVGPTGQETAGNIPVNYVATLTFEWQPGKISTVKQRLINPLGLTVMSFGTTQEVINAK
ncbi:MAG: type IV secretion system protein [Psittacicella sp.]